METLNPELGSGIEALFSGKRFVYYDVKEGDAVRRVEESGRGQRNYSICTRDFADLAGLGEGVAYAHL